MRGLHSAEHNAATTHSHPSQDFILEVDPSVIATEFVADEIVHLSMVLKKDNSLQSIVNKMVARLKFPTFQRGTSGKSHFETKFRSLIRSFN